MTTHRLQVTLPAVSALNEDASTNVWHHYANDGTIADDHALSIFGALVEFYNAPITVGSVTRSVAAYLSTRLDRGANKCVIKAYSLDAPTPRTPHHTHTFTLAAAQSASTPLPSELAVVLSYRAQLISGTDAKNRRGRIYLGPLNNFSSDAPSNGDSRPKLEMQQIVAAAANRFRLAMQALNVPWVVYSPTNNANYGVDEGWVDNAWDIQRRRGIRPTLRTPFP